MHISNLPNYGRAATNDDHDHGGRLSRIVLRRTKSRRRDTPKLHTPTRLGDSKHPLSFLWRSSTRALRRTTFRYFVRFFKSTLLHSGRIVSLASIPTSGKDQTPPIISLWWQQTSSAFSLAFVHPFPPENGRSNPPQKNKSTLVPPSVST